MEAEEEQQEVPSRPCKRRRRCESLPSDEPKCEQSPGTADSTQPITPSNEETKKHVVQGRQPKNPPRSRVIVIALPAPSQMTNYKNSLAKGAKSATNCDSKGERRRPLAAELAAVSGIYRVTELSGGCCNFLQDGRLKLSGCAVVPRGILVVEGGMNSIQKLLKFFAGKEQKTGSLEVIWQGKVERPSFGKFSILHCNNDFAASKFFADHGALHYWKLAVNPPLAGS